MRARGSIIVKTAIGLGHDLKSFSSFFGRSFLALTFLLLVAPSAQAVEPVRQFQVDVVPITTSLGTPVVTQAETQALIDRVNAGMDDATGGVIRFTLRSILPTIAPGTPVTTLSDVGKVSGITPKADPGFESAILIGVIVTDQSLSFAGVAWGQYMLVNSAWNRMSSSLLTHEFGHNFGLFHANSVTCTTALPIVCEQLEYGDYSSVMGKYVYAYVAQPYIARFSATELDKLKVLPSNKRLVATETGEYKLAPVYSNSIDLPKVLYIPIGNENAYSVEYRPAIGNDGSLAQPKINASNGGSYTNIQSHGLQLRIIQTVGTDYLSLLPKISSNKQGWFGTGLVSDTLNGSQVQPLGKTFLLSDGSTVTFVSADPNIGAVVKVVRAPDTEAPKVTASEARWAWENGSYYSGPNQERLVKRSSITAWDFPALEISAKGISDNRLLKSLELEINGKVVDQLIGSAITPTVLFKYQTTEVGKFDVRLLASDYAGNTAATPSSNLETMYFTLDQPPVSTNVGKDPQTSISFSFYSYNKNYTYELTDLSSGIIQSTTEKNDFTIISIINIPRNTSITAKLTGRDELGHTDGGQILKGTVSEAKCSNTACFVGGIWNVETGFWSPGAGAMSLQENIKGKWINISSAKPVALKPKDKKYPNTYQISVNYTAPGTHTYRLYIAPNKLYGVYIGKPFKQVVKN